MFLSVFPTDCTSSSLARLDYASLSQECLMEMVVDGFDTKIRIWGSTEHPADLSQWTGVTLNENGEVVSIHWIALDVSGSLALEWLPTTVTVTETAMTDLSGTLELTKLPEVLVTLFLSTNKFIGSIDLTRLPNTLELLNVGKNDLSGTLDLRSLPPRLRQLTLSSNFFRGETDFSQLPVSLIQIDCSTTSLSGTIVRQGNLKFVDTFLSLVSVRSRYK
mmetsp:Transcript_34334/g.53605  ORF Transcript_34334/g.53605 Transcript_34334/m.53605 type:complete len:219 (-) Transcript_34334:24-680(-)